MSIYTTGGLHTQGWLYDSNDDLLAWNYDTTRDGQVEANFRILWTLTPGVYYVSVRSADRRTAAGGDYTLHFQTRIDDHGNSFQTSTSLQLGSSVAGRIEHPGDDWDYFKLDLSGRSGLTDVWIYTTGAIDTRGWLYESGGDSYLVFNNDSYIEGRATGFQIRRHLSSGVYYIRVQGWLAATGDYTLQAEAVTDPGSTTGTATPLSLDSPVPGTVDTASDADYFRLLLAESTNLVVDTKGLDLWNPDGAVPVAPLGFAVFDNGGAEISVNVHAEMLDGDRYGFRIEDEFEAGTYYVKVTTPSGVSSHPVPYTIHAYEDTVYTAFIDDCTTATASLNNREFDDPLYGCQWHINNADGEDINVEAVWAEGVNGEGVNIAVVDDTMDYSHEDLAGNIDSSLSHDYGSMSGAYRPFDHHGTAVAGIIAARDNGAGVLGVAPRATIYGYNYLAGDWQLFQDRNRADAMARNRVVTAVSNNSWGPPDGPWWSPAHRLWELAVESGVREGFNGKGTFYVFSVGNGGRGHRLNPDGTLVGGHYTNVKGRGDDSNLNELANYYAVTAVCAVNDADTRTVYSEKGANLWVCAPSGEDERRGIVTTENSDRYRSDFDGTSASAPIVSGVAALLRDANPDLTWRDLRLILAASARKNDAENPGWVEGAQKYRAYSTDGHYHFNHEYGFGVVDAKAAVDLARGWTNLPPLETVRAANPSATTIPPPLGSVPQTVTSSITVDTVDTGLRFTEFVEINTDFDHTSFRDMDIELVSPSGTVSKLAVPFNTRHYQDTYYRADGSSYEDTYFVRLDGAFRFGSARHLGEDPNGVWTLRLSDHYPELGGTLRSWGIKVYGHRQDLPGPPVIATPITVDLNSLAIAWNAPSSDGGQAILGYDLRYIRTESDETVEANWTVVEDVWTAGSGLLAYTITALSSGTQYDVQVRAVTAVDDGPWSLPASAATPSAGVPGAPAIQSVSSGTNSLTVSWTPPLDGGRSPITDYDLRHISSDAPDKSDTNWMVVQEVWTGSGALSYGLTGLAGGTQYIVQVRANSAHGDGPWSATATGTAQTAGTSGVSRAFSTPWVDPLGQLTVTITGAGAGAAQVVETLPAGFTYSSSSLLDSAVDVLGQRVTFTLQGDDSFNYKVTAPSTEGVYSFQGVLRRLNGMETTIGGTFDITVSSVPVVVLSLSSNPPLQIRIGSPVAVTATFNEAVSGFTVDDIIVANGTVINFVEGDEAMVYTFDVIPRDIAKVTVDIAANLAMDSNGTGNAAAAQLSFTPYDDDGDGNIGRAEAIAAISDYFSGKLTRGQAIAVISLYFASGTT